MNDSKKIGEANISQEQIESWAEEYAAKENSQEIKMQEILSNTDYIKWLEVFTIENSNFSDNDWLYFPEQISKEDSEQVDKLHLLYSGIENYASANYIYPIDCDFGNFYRIRLANTGFKIGVLVGQGILFFCNRVEIENEEDFIDFDDIINNKKRDNEKAIENKLNELSNLVVSLYESGVPLNAIKITIDNILNEISKQSNLEEVKVLKK